MNRSNQDDALQCLVEAEPLKSVGDSRMSDATLPELLRRWLESPRQAAVELPTAFSLDDEFPALLILLLLRGNYDW